MVVCARRRRQPDLRLQRSDDGHGLGVAHPAGVHDAGRRRAARLFTNAEERMFRTGAQYWSGRRRALKVLEFGLIHTVIGIPIGVALALSVGGHATSCRSTSTAFAATGSSEEATLESTRAHTAYNALIITTVFAVVAIAAATA